MRRVNRRRRDSVIDQLIKEQSGLDLAMHFFREPSFLAKRVRFKPVHQLAAIGRDYFHLRVMRMRVDEAG